MKLVKIICAVFLLSGVMGSCKKEIFIPSETDTGDWSEASHSNNVDPNYAVVFNQDEVNRIDIVLTADEWTDMQTDLADVLANSGGMGSFSDQTPQYFACDFYFKGKKWSNVGVRYKGNSSLEATSRSNNAKLPLRLDFDKFETEYPEITNQRFYGFKELSLANNFKDLALMREKSAADLFRHFGVPAVRTAFYEVYIDRGNGAEYFGVYTMIEVVFDTFLKDYFGSKSGNCYKPEDNGATFSVAGFNLDDFELKTNEVANDKSDIQELYNTLHASNRTTDAAAWRSNLESLFDVDGFLKYLAVNNTIQNWDTYGLMTHNYYLYHDPKDGLIKWIVWDNNEAFTAGVGNRNAVSFSMSEVGTAWPMINYIISDPTYLATYKSYIQSFITSSFTYDRMNTIYSEQESFLYNSAASERTGYTFLTGGIGSFTSAVSTLRSHCSTRIAAADAYSK